MDDKLTPMTSVVASMSAEVGVEDKPATLGVFQLECHDDKGEPLWVDEFNNLLTTVGANMILTAGVAGSTPAFMGLISSVTFSAVNVADTMASHAGWTEAQNTGTNVPAFGTVRPTITWSTPAASAINTTSTQSFVFTNSGTVQGGFVVTGSGASATVANTSGVLMSAGTLAAAQPVISGNTVTMSYTLTI